eukprot:m.193774 g.193774  ORF g.193774 m.193774 type:complete len:1167 (-) comp14884_c2_seq1:264-3764(-)
MADKRIAAANRKALMAVLESTTVLTDMLELYQQHMAIDDQFNLDDAFLSMQSSKRDMLWQSLSATFATQYHEHLTGPSLCEATEKDISEDCAKALDYYEIIAHLLALVVDNCETVTVSPSCLQSLSIAHDAMLSIPPTHSKLQNHVLKVCETWYFNEMPDREQVVSSTASLMLMKAHAEDASTASVKRVFAFREVFGLFDLADKQAESMKVILLRSFVSPGFVLKTDGQRFLSHILTLDRAFMGQCHQTIKEALPHCTSSFTQGYSNVYFRAWRSCSDELRPMFEKECVQDLMYHAVHASRKGALGTKSFSATLSMVLEEFHEHKKERGVDDMLFNMYQPILWRSLAVANAAVRANASCLLIKAFPLQDSEANRAANDALMQKQFDAVLAMLDDASPMVRCIGVEGVCRILTTYWELMPSAVTAAMLEKLFNQCARDAASIAVRTSVLKGVAFLLDNPLAQGTLKPMLSALSPMLFDSARSVRSAFLDLLLTVKGIKDIKFYDVTQLDHLLTALEMAHPKLAVKLVQLLRPSYFPLKSKSTDEDRLSRCVSFVSDHRGAARVFYHYLNTATNTSDLARFTVVLANYIVSASEAEEDRDPLQDSFGDMSENPEIAECTLELLEVIAILVRSIAAVSKSGQTLRKLSEPLSPLLSHVEATFESGSQEAKLGLVISAMLPYKAPAEQVTSMLDKLARLSPTATGDIKAIVSWLLAAKQAPAVIFMCEKWLTKLNVAHKPKYVAGKKVRGETPPASSASLPKPSANTTMGLAVLSCLLDALTPKAKASDELTSLPFKGIVALLTNVPALIEERAAASQELSTTDGELCSCIQLATQYLVLYTASDVLTTSEWDASSEACKFASQLAQACAAALSSVTDARPKPQKRSRKKAQDGLNASTAHGFIVEAFTTIHVLLRVAPLPLETVESASALADTILATAADASQLRPVLQFTMQLAAASSGEEHEYDTTLRHLVPAVLEWARLRPTTLDTFTPTLNQLEKVFQRRRVMTPYLQLVTDKCISEIVNKATEDAPTPLCRFFSTHVARDTPLAETFALTVLERLAPEEEETATAVLTLLRLLAEASTSVAHWMRDGMLQQVSQALGSTSKTFAGRTSSTKRSKGAEYDPLLGDSMGDDEDGPATPVRSSATATRALPAALEAALTDYRMLLCA